MEYSPIIWKNNYSLEYARTMAFCMLAFFQIWNVQNSRSYDRSLFFNLPFAPVNNDGHPDDNVLDRISPLRNPVLLAVMLLAITLQVAAVEIPFMNDLLHTVNLGLYDWGLIIGISFSIIIFIELVKIFRAIIAKARA